MDFEEVINKCGDKSSVWFYFLRTKDKVNAKCKICQKILKCVGGSTGGLMKHIKNVHKKNLNTDGTVNHNVIPLASTSVAGMEGIPKKKVKMTDHFESDVNPSMEIMVSRMTAKDGCSFRIFAESKDMRKLFQNSGHNLPMSATAIKNMVIKEADKKKQLLMEEIQKMLKDNCRFSISFDEWTSIRNRRYITLNLHSPNLTGHNNFKNLGLIRIYGSLPAKKCIDEIKLKLAEFGVSLENIVAETTDGCSMMTKFGSLLKSYHQKCIAHALQLAINDVFYNKSNVFQKEQDEEISVEVESDENDDIPLAELVKKYNNKNSTDYTSENDSDDDLDSLLIEECPSPHNEQKFEYHNLLQKIKTVVKLFRKSPTKNDDVLQKYVVSDFKKEYSLTNDCKTRWGSLANTLERFLKLRSCIVKALIDIKSNITFTEDDWTVMGQLYEVLDIIKTVLEALCRRDATLLTADVAVKFGLKKMAKLNSNISKRMAACLKKRYTERRLTETAILEYLHNPESYFTSAQDEDFTVFPRPDSNEMYTQIVSLLQRTKGVQTVLERSVEDEQVPQPVQDNREPQSKAEELNAEILKATDVVRKRIRFSQEHDDLHTTVRFEMALFENGGDRGRNLSLAYNYLLTIPPTSVEPERVFSSAGLFCNKIRSRLSDKTLDALIFLRMQYNEQSK